MSLAAFFLRDRDNTPEKLLCLAVMVPLWQLDGVWLFPFVSGILSAATAIIIVKSIKIQ